MPETETIPNDDIVGVSDVAQVLQVSEQRVRALFRSKEIPARRIGAQWITSSKSVEGYLKAMRKHGPPDQRRKSKKLPKIRALSFFSGALGLDQGLELAGIRLLLACEFDRASRSTILANRPEIGLIGNIWEYDAETIRQYAGLTKDDHVDVMVGGPPCQAFSTAGSRRGFGDDRGNAFLRFIDLITEIQPNYAVIENVRGLLSQPMKHQPHSKRNDDWVPDMDELPGGALEYVLGILRSAGYSVTFNLYNAANFGVPQARERVIMICYKGDDPVPHLIPTHSKNGEYGLKKWRTVREAFAGLGTENVEGVNFPEERLRFYRHLAPGQYWKHLPAELHREALGNSLDSGGGKTGFLRRLDWDKPSCTLVTSPVMPATDICHPELDRPISIQEYMRLQQFPDDWKVCGSITERYKQLGNAVPVGLGEAVGRAITAHMKGRRVSPPEGFAFSRYKATDEISWTKNRDGLKRKLLGNHGQAKLF